MEDSSPEDDLKPAAITDAPMAEGEDGATSPAHHGNVKVKPALKKDSRRKAKDRRDKHLKWDEQVIEEHDQLRGTRMKIDEPNTPYTHYDSGAESDDSRRPKSPANQKQTLSWDTLQTRLDSVAAVREQYPPASPTSSHAGETDQSDVEDDRKSEMRKLEFKEHRKRHYNEMELVKKFRQEHPDDVLDDGEQDGDGDADDEAGNASE